MVLGSPLLDPMARSLSAGVGGLKFMAKHGMKRDRTTTCKRSRLMRVPNPFFDISLFEGSTRLCGKRLLLVLPV